MGEGSHIGSKHWQELEKAFSVKIYFNCIKDINLFYLDNLMWVKTLWDVDAVWQWSMQE